MDLNMVQAFRHWMGQLHFQLLLVPWFFMKDWDVLLDNDGLDWLCSFTLEIPINQQGILCSALHCLMHSGLLDAIFKFSIMMDKFQEDCIGNIPIRWRGGEVCRAVGKILIKF